MGTRNLEKRQKEIDAAITEMVDLTDSYLLAAPFMFIEGQEGAPGEYIFPSEYQPPFTKFHAWIQRPMEILYPRTRESIKTIQAGKAGDDEYMDLCYDAQRFGFLWGVLAGMKAMGASRDELLNRARGFVVPIIGYLKWRQAQQEKKRSSNSGGKKR